MNIRPATVRSLPTPVRFSSSPVTSPDRGPDGDAKRQPPQPPGGKALRHSTLRSRSELTAPLLLSPALLELRDEVLYAFANLGLTNRRPATRAHFAAFLPSFAPQISTTLSPGPKSRSWPRTTRDGSLDTSSPKCAFHGSLFGTEGTPMGGKEWERRLELTLHLSQGGGAITGTPWTRHVHLRPSELPSTRPREQAHAALSCVPASRRREVLRSFLLVRRGEQNTR